MADADNDDIKKRLIVKAYPNRDLTGKDAAYLAHAYDGALELLDGGTGNASETIAGKSGDSHGAGAKGEKNKTLDQADKEQREALTGLSTVKK